MKIIEQWYKPVTVWLLVAANVLAGAAMFLPEIQQALPDDWYRWAFALILVARLIKQGAKDAANP